MAEELEQLETLEADVEVEVQDPVAEDQTDPTPAKDEPFLSVNERTVYKTREDAARGYNEAASRIAQLSGWEKSAKAYGLSDPKQFEAVAKELLELRKDRADAAAKLNSAPKIDPADPKAKETQQVRDYLKNLGYVSKDDQTAALKELQERLDRFEASGQQSEEQRFQNQEAEARNDLGGYLSAAGVKDDANGTKAQVIGTLVKDWINGSDERIEQWTRGGVAAKTLVKDGVDLAIGMLGWKAAAKPAGALQPSDPGYAAAKARAVAANKKLPAQGTAKGAEKPAPKQKGHINAKLHDEAWKVLQASRTE